MMRSTTLDETRPETRGPLAAVVEHLTRHARARGLVRRLSEAQHPVPLPGAARPLALALLHVVEERPLLVVTSRATRARRLQQEIAAWSPAPDRVLLFPEHDPLPYERLAGNPEHLVERLQALQALALGRRSPLVVVASARALMDRLMAPDAFRRSLQVLRVGQRVAPTRLIEDWLVRGYQLVPLVEEPGQCSRRGGIVDIYPPGATPYRLEFFGDEIDSIRPFDPATQRSTAHVPEVLVGPASEVLVAPTTAAVADLRRLDLDGLSDPYRQATAQEIAQVAAGQSFPMLLRYRGYLGEHSLLDYLPDGGLVVLDDEHDVALQVRHLEQQAEEIRRDLERQRELPVGFRRPYWEWSEVAASLARRPCLRLAAGDDEDTSPFRPAPFFAGKLRDALRLCQEERLGGRRVIVVTQQAPRVAELFEELGESVTAAERLASPLEPLALVHASLGEGFASPELELLVLTDRELFGWTKTPRSTRPRTFGDRSALLSDLQPGDLVVHVDHGIGRYAGLVRLGDGASEREYLLVEYAEGDRLYVPVEQSDRLTRYFGGGEQQPTLTRLRGGEWEQTKRRVRRATRELARDLLSLYAAREVAVGHAFSADTPWQHELEGSFPYVETPDQLRVLAEVKADMERPRPMDRVVVGDVGYGKTEIALRAAFKAVMDGKQVAVLVPTTVLAYQHYQTFRERLQAFPVRVEMLSRFRTEAEQRAVVEGLKTGAVDICIGTHRLLQNDVGFRDLGLVIIDEEQRFGVAHKERLKQMRREVDVLTLSATPIPRTLHLALVGVRDMSTIETPPEDRLPVRTYIMESDDGLVRDAILRELDRGGQVFFLHNRVRSIAAVANHLRKLVPSANIAIAHGQMPEDDLERVMLEFADGQHDVLVCTTIIENGLDLPNVNTIIVNNAHRLGLAQLYQLRGRVGRGAVRAYAYFLYPRDARLTEQAAERLRTIGEATELGAGFRVALRDLEIRGAGNILGAEQHGHIAAVGFELYCQLLAQAVEELRVLRGEAPREPRAESLPPPSSVVIDLPLPAFLPSDYVAEEAMRLSLYQRLASARRPDDLARLAGEIEDRFGPPPEAAQNLLAVADLRMRAREAGVQEIVCRHGEVAVVADPLPSFDARRLQRQLGVPLRVAANQVRFPWPSHGDLLTMVRCVVDALRQGGHAARPTVATAS